jgi:very-short-patch-repair endonuclease
VKDVKSFTIFLDKENLTVLSINEIENKLQCQLSKEKIDEISSLEEVSLKGIRKDLTGQQFERLLVIGRGPSYISPGGVKQTQWWCICKCKEHNIVLIRVSNLTSHNSKSCGCLNIEKAKERIIEIGHGCAKNLTNQSFGELKALYPTEKRKNGSVVWVCKCSCGKEHLVNAHDLVHHRIESCGHNKDSKGVRKIKEILKDNNIDYITEKTFNTCKFPDTNASARFDFYLPKYNLLIEYDGEQHFKEKDTNYFKDSLEKRQAHDLFKNNWCKENNIPLIRFSYLELNKISINTILGGVLK